VTPPTASIAPYRASARPELLTVRTFPRGDHRLQAGDPPQLVEGYLRELVAFLERSLA
jgi:hypothetical protein